MTSQSSPTKSRSSTSSANWVNVLGRAGYFGIRLALVALALALLTPLCAGAQTHGTGSIDQRVSKLSAQTLLTTAATSLVDPNRQRAARQLARIHEGLFLFGAVAQILALLVLWRTGSSARMRDTFRRATRSVFVQRFSFGIVLGLTAGIANLPFAFFWYRVMYGSGLTAEPIGTWFAGYFNGLSLAAAGVGAIVVIVLFLVDRLRLWYLLVAAMVYVVVVGATFAQPSIDPLASRYGQVAPSALLSTLHRLTERAGLGDPPIYYVLDPNAQSFGTAARVEGIGHTRRIVLSDALLQSASERELAFVVAHEIAQYTAEDNFKEALAASTLLVLAAALAVLVSDRIGFRRDDDPLSRLALVGCLLGTSLVFCAPIYNAFAQMHERRADAAAVAMTHDPADGVRVMVRLADDGMSAVCEPWYARVLFYGEPSLGSRIAAIAGNPDSCQAAAL